MFRNYFINREWIVSSTARHIYRCAAILSLALFFVVSAVRLGTIPETLIPALKLPIFAGVVGTAVTMIGMEYFLFGFDKSSATKKAFWFCMMLFPLIGRPLYCFMVHSRSEVLQTSAVRRRSAFPYDDGLQSSLTRYFALSGNACEVVGIYPPLVPGH
jgi:hypothetical protein